MREVTTAYSMGIDSKTDEQASVCVCVRERERERERERNK